MLNFDFERFLCMLRTAPEARPFLEPAVYSEYLQRQVFDQIKRHGWFDLSGLNWDELPPCQSFLPDQRELYAEVDTSWTKGINFFFRKTPAASLTERPFF